MTELEKLGFTKTQMKDYIEWENKRQDIRISYIKRSQTVYIRKASERKPVTLFAKELMALLVDVGLAEITR